MRDPYRTIYHRDGSVTVWNVYTQSYERHSARALVDQCGPGRAGNLILPTLTDEERQRIIRMAGA